MMPCYRCRKEPAEFERKGRGVCVDCARELDQMAEDDLDLASDLEQAIRALLACPGVLSALCAGWPGETKRLETALEPRSSPVDDTVSLTPVGEAALKFNELVGPLLAWRKWMQRYPGALHPDESDLLVAMESCFPTNKEH
jgi:hypothetical protein